VAAAAFIAEKFGNLTFSSTMRGRSGERLGECDEPGSDTTCCAFSNINRVCGLWP